MTKKLIAERISRTEEAPLSTTDIYSLKDKRIREFLLLLSGYLPFVGFGAFILFRGPDSLNAGHDPDLLPYTKITIDEAQKSRFRTVAPYFVAF
jgi:hypothetical protein